MLVYLKYGKKSISMIQPTKQYSSNIILSLILLLAVTLLSIIGIVLYSVKSVNEESNTTIEDYLSATITDKLNQHKTITKDYAYWSDTVQNAYLSPDPKWIDENIGKYLTDTFKITDQFIINSHNDAVLSIKDGQVDQSNYLTINKDALTKLIVKARQSGPLPVPVSGILMINDTPALVGLSVLAPDDGTFLPSPRPLLLLAKRLNPDYLQVLSKQYRLRDLHFTPGNQDDVTLSSVEIKNPLNKILGELSWQAEKPGNLVLTKIQLPLVILLIATSIITAFIIMAFRTTTRRLEKAYDDLTFNANHDALTGLANRRLLNELLKQTIHSVKRDHISSAILCIDLDRFKYINDTHGHQAGDFLLVTMAERLNNCVREADTISRIGGDEFIVLLHNTSDRDDIKTTAQKIQDSLMQPIKISDNEVQISACIGIVIIPDDGTDPDELLTKADKALYECKHQGGSIFQFYADLS